MTVLCDSCSPREGCTAEKNRTECKYYQPMTNEEWIKQCNTEQLAEWIKGHMNCNFCPMRLKCEDMRDCMETLIKTLLILAIITFAECVIFMGGIIWEAFK